MESMPLTLTGQKFGSGIVCLLFSLPLNLAFKNLILPNLDGYIFLKPEVNNVLNSIFKDMLLKRSDKVINTSF